MVQQRRVEAVEQAVADHDLLAATRAPRPACPRNTISPAQLRRDRRQGDRRADPGRGHRVVAAAVAEARQRVVLGEDADPRPVPAPAAGQPAADGRREAAGRMLHREAVAGDGLGDPARRLVLLERRLRVGVDPVGQVEDLVAGGLDGRGDPALDVGERLGGVLATRSAGSMVTGAPSRAWRSTLGGEGGLGDETMATTNRTIGRLKAPCRRRTTKTVTTTATQAPRRTARIQSPR